jgi:hypothetical protein
MAVIGWLFFQNPRPFPPAIFPWLLVPKPQGVYVAGVSMGLLLWWSWKGTRLHALPHSIFYGVVLLNMALGIIFYGGLYQQSPGLVAVSHFLLWVSLGLTFLYLLEAEWLRKSYRGQEIVRVSLRVKFPLLVIVALVLRVLLIQSSPRPAIDVFIFLNQGVQELLHGNNPYEALYPSPHPDGEVPDMPTSSQEENPLSGHRRDVYWYWPGALLGTLPGALIGRDVRYSYILADLFIVFLILRLAGCWRAGCSSTERLLGEWTVLLFLFHPRWSLMLEQAWTESLLIVWSAGAAVLLQKIEEGAQSLTQTSINPVENVQKGEMEGQPGQAAAQGAQAGHSRQRWLQWCAALCFGMLISTKQYAALLLPFIYLIPRHGKRLLLMSLITPAVLLLPFILWNPQEFYHDTLKVHVEIAPRFDSLSLYSAWHWWLDKAMIPFANFIAYSLVVGFVWWRRDLLIRGASCIAIFLSCCAVALFCFFLFANHSFLNYYWFASTLLLLAYAAQGGTRRTYNPPC